MEIKLTQDKVTIIDDELYKPLLKYMEENHIGKWCVSKDRNYFYVVANVNKKGKKQGKKRLHRIIAKIGSLPKPSSKHNQIDHINRDGLDNRICNLRWVTCSQNKYNSKKYKNNSSGFIGVCWHERYKMWIVHIQFKGETKHIGYFDKKDRIDAARAYDKKKIKLTGEYYGLNFPKEDYL